MKKLNLWMLAAILTISGAVTLTSCSDNSDNPVEPAKPTERTTFEQQFSTTIEEAAKIQELQTTTHATEVLTAFISQLNMEALAPQISQILQTVLGSTQPLEFSTLGDDEQEAREAMNNTFSNFQSDMFILTDASQALNGTRMTFVEGEPEMKYETGAGDGLVIAYQNPTTKEETQLKLQFSGVNNGVALFLAKMANTIPVAVRFPYTISFTINHTHDGVSGDVMEGVVTLKAPDGKKFISLQGSEWELGLGINSARPDRYELPMAIMHHYADGRLDGAAGLAINDQVVLDINIQNTGTPYEAAKMEELKALRQQGPLFAAFYEVLSMFNSRSAKAQLNVMSDLTFDLDVNDAGQAMMSLGTAINMYNNNPAKADMDPLTEQLNKSFTFKVTQKSTGITADGILVTALIDGVYRPAVALRFNGESDYKVLWDQMNEKDRANYEKLLKSFDEPGRMLHKLFLAFDQKRSEFEKVNPFK